MSPGPELRLPPCELKPLVKRDTPSATGTLGGCRKKSYSACVARGQRCGGRTGRRGRTAGCRTHDSALSNAEARNRAGQGHERRGKRLVTILPPWGRWVNLLLWGGQSWPQPPFQAARPAGSRLRAELPAPRKQINPLPELAHQPRERFFRPCRFVENRPDDANRSSAPQKPCHGSLTL